MKRFIKRFLDAIVAIAISLISVDGVAQEVVPMDSAYRVGRLDNGLTYYVRHNEYPKGTAEFYIAQKVGSILEEDNQRGLAHFLEHMCFNGTKHFPGQTAIGWLQSIGVKFGAHVNAYTNYDETVYTLKNVPTERVSVQDSCLLLLRDWATDLTLDDADIDAERGVVHEEWRMRNSPMMRLYDELLPKVMPNNKYTERLPIGTMEVVDNFPHQVLRDFYEKWYRPDQQAIIAVGDIDVDRVEAKIKEMFSTVEMPQNPAPREYVKIEDLPGTLFAIGKDKEVLRPMFEFNFMHDCFTPEFKQTYQYLIWNYFRNAIVTMLKIRFNDVILGGESAMFETAVDYQRFESTRTKMTLAIIAQCSGNDVRKTFADAYREILRVQRFGFTDAEYTRLKESMSIALDKEYANRATTPNEAYSNNCVENFLSGKPLNSIETRLAIYKDCIGNMPLEVVNNVARQFLTPENRKVMIYLPDNSEYVQPTEQEMQECMAGVEAEEILPYDDNEKAEPLIPLLLPAGKIVSEAHNDPFDATEWTLSNGVKVIVKPTTLKDDEILFGAYARGGYNSLDDSFTPVIKLDDLIVPNHGYGSYSMADMHKYFTSKQVYLRYDFDTNQREISGEARINSLSALMELIYASFTEFAITESDYNYSVSSIRDLLPTLLQNPGNQFANYLNHIVFESPRQQIFTAEDLDAVSREKVLDYVQKMLANPADYTFVFVGNLDMESLKALVEQYIASLPTDRPSQIQEKIDAAVYAKAGSCKQEIKVAMEVPQSYLYVGKFMQRPYNLRNYLTAFMAGSILSDRLRIQIREEMGATYDVDAGSVFNYLEQPNLVMRILCNLNPDLKDRAVECIEAEFTNIETTVTADEVQTVREYLLQTHQHNLAENQYFLDDIETLVLADADFQTDFEATLNGITVDDIQAFFRDLNRNNNAFIVMLSPETAEK